MTFPPWRSKGGPGGQTRAPAREVRVRKGMSCLTAGGHGGLCRARWLRRSNGWEEKEEEEEKEDEEEEAMEVGGNSRKAAV